MLRVHIHKGRREAYNKLRREIAVFFRSSYNIEVKTEDVNVVRRDWYYLFISRAYAAEINGRGLDSIWHCQCRLSQVGLHSP